MYSSMNLSASFCTSLDFACLTSVLGVTIDKSFRGDFEGGPSSFFTLFKFISVTLLDGYSFYRMSTHVSYIVFFISLELLESFEDITSYLDLRTLVLFFGVDSVNVRI